MEDEAPGKENDYDLPQAPGKESFRRSPTAGLYVLIVAAGTVIVISSGHLEWFIPPVILLVILFFAQRSRKRALQRGK